MKRGLTILAATLMLGGCAIHDGRPRVANFEVNDSYKLKSAAHWRVVADDIAERIVKATKGTSKPIFVPASDDTTFRKVFASQLKSALMSKGATLSPAGDSAVHVSITVDQVNHLTIDRYRPGTLTKLAGAVLVLREFTETNRQTAGAIAGLAVAEDVIRSANEIDKRPVTEVVMTTVVKQDTGFLMHATDVYYIDSVDSSLFSNGARNFEVVGGAHK